MFRYVVHCDLDPLFLAGELIFAIAPSCAMNPTMQKKKNTPESDLQAAAKHLLELNGFKVVRNHMGLMLYGGQATTNPNRGMPDLQAIKYGCSMWIECKKPGWKPPGKRHDARGLPNAHAYQCRWLEDLRDAGCIAEFVDSLEYLATLIQRFEEAHGNPSGRARMPHSA